MEAKLFHSCAPSVVDDDDDDDDDDGARPPLLVSLTISRATACLMSWWSAMQHNQTSTQEGERESESVT